MDEESLAHRVREILNTGGARIVLGLVALGVIVFAVVRFVGSDELEGRRRAIRERGRRVYYVCKACEATGEARVGYDEPFPIVCPKCGRREAVMGFKCVGCGRIIEKRSEPVYRCPHCGKVYDNRAGRVPVAP